MRRRDFIGSVGAAALWPAVAGAQQRPTTVIGWLLPGSEPSSRRFLDGFRSGMKQNGYLEGQEYVLEQRYTDADLSRLQPFADELVRLKPAVILSGTSAAALAVKQATASIPIVGVNLTDPVGVGLIQSEARPGTNVTGTLQYVDGMTGKQVEIARELLPDANKVGLLVNPKNVLNSGFQQREAEAAAAKLAMRVVISEAQTADEIKPAFQKFTHEAVNVVLVTRDQLFLSIRRQIAELSLSLRLPTVYAFREHVESGGLISYGVDIRANYFRAASYVDRILKGEKPADLPIEFPNKLELVINLKTATALGINIPLFLQQRADDVIE